MSKKRLDEPYWTPLPRPHFSTAQTAGIVARHLIPIVGVLFFGWSASQFLLLSVFNIGFTIACMGCIAAAIAQHRQAVPSASRADAIAGWITLFATGLLATLLFTAMFGWVIGLFVKWKLSIVWGALATMVFAAPAVIQQYQTDLASPLTEEERKKRDQPNIIGLVLCAGLLFMMSGYIEELGRFGLVIVVIAATGLFIFRDLRPDLMRELTRPKNMPPPSEYGEAAKNHDFLGFILRGMKPKATKSPPGSKNDPGNPHL
ncbi:MAG: hypothetical protein ABI843_04405 [Dokdonella sp.]